MVQAQEHARYISIHTAQEVVAGNFPDFWLMFINILCGMTEK